jgi:hypothetical protein
MKQWRLPLVRWRLHVCLLWLLLPRSRPATWPRMLMTGLSARIPEFDPRPAYVESEVEELELRHSWKNNKTLMHYWEWAESRSRYSDLLRAGRSGDRIPVGARFFARPDRPWGPPSLLYNGYRVFPGGKVRPGRASDHSHPSSAKVFERIQLYLYPPLGHNRVCNGGYFTLLGTLHFRR